MVTQRRNGTGSPDGFHALLGIYDAIKALESRRRPITPENVVKALRKQPGAAFSALNVVAAALPHIQQWRSHQEIAPLLEHRSQLGRLELYFRKRQQALVQDLADVRDLIDDLDKLLEQQGVAGKLAAWSLQ